MMSFKAFLATQDDNISDSEAIEKYNDYKLEFQRQQLNEFFVAHKDDEWWVGSFKFYVRSYDFGSDSWRVYVVGWINLKHRIKESRLGILPSATYTLGLRSVYNY